MARDHEESQVSGLSVKLKLPRFGVEDKEAVAVDMEENLKSVCRICHKEFKSDKALGGHMRIHFHRTQQQKEQALDVKKIGCCIKMKKEQALDVKKIGCCIKMKKEKPICSICGRDFNSMKSLFGHMRCHPNRGWRGIHPPGPKLIASPSTSYSSCLSSSGAAELSRWGTRGRRGRQAVEAGASSEASSSEDKQMLQAANYLMLLASGRTCCESKVEVVQNSPVSESETHQCLVGTCVVSETHLVYEEESDNKLNGKKCTQLQYANYGFETGADDKALGGLFGFDLNQLPPSEENESGLNSCW